MGVMGEDADQQFGGSAPLLNFVNTEDLSWLLA
jgi:hypothetical protein